MRNMAKIGHVNDNMGTRVIRLIGYQLLTVQKQDLHWFMHDIKCLSSTQPNKNEFNSCLLC